MGSFLGERSSKKGRLARMEMWKPFRKSTNKKAPQAAILFDKFIILMHLGDALDKVRKQEYAKLDGDKRKFIKGQKYALLSHQENLQGSARKNLKILLAANKRLNTAYVLKESFGQLWDYNREAWARKFFENWRDQLKWQRLKPYENFAEMIDTHWDGIAAYCKPENKVPLGFVEGLNNKMILRFFRALPCRFSWWERSAYCWPLMNLRFSPSSLAYSCFLTLSSASPRCIRMWNLSNRMAAWGAFLFVDFRNGFHISIRARRPFLLLLSPRKEPIHALLRATYTPDPDRAPPIEIGHNDTI